MRKICFVLLLYFWLLPKPTMAQMVPDSILSQINPVATETGLLEQARVESKSDLTQPTQPIKSKLEKVWEDNPIDKLNYYNFLRYALEKSVGNGVPITTVILVILFPLVVTIVAAARHLIGIRGVGILTPALLSVAFLATGIWVGVALFLIILLVATGSRILLKKLKLQYLPRLALLLWIVTGGVLATLIASSYLPIASVITVGIFPILILMLLAETFIDLQQGRSAREARDIIFQTFLLAIATSFVLQWDLVHRFVLLYPEVMYFGVGIFDIFMGKYTGLRLSEYLMFRELAKGEEEEE